MDLSDPQFTAEFWGWAGRIASAAAIIRIVVAILALLIAWSQLRHIQADQRRIADELTKGPRLKLFFQQPYGAPESTEDLPVALLHPTWQPGNPLSDPVQLWVSVANAGGRSARRVRCNVTFPGVVKQMKAAPHDVRPDPLGNLFVTTVAEDANSGTELHYPMVLFVERIDAFEGVVIAPGGSTPYTWSFGCAWPDHSLE